MYKVQADQSLASTLLTLGFKGENATATVNNKAYEDNANRTITLGSGTIVVTIVVKDGDLSKTYRIEIAKPTPGGGEEDPGHGGGTVTRPAYPPVITDAEHGTVTVSPTRPHQGDKVTITATPDEGYKVGEVTVTKPGGGKVAVTGQGDGKYTFTQPGGKVTITVTFIPEGWPFVDVSEKDWFYGAVEYVYSKGIMKGTSATTFSPKNSLTRAMVAQILYNLEGEPAVTGDDGFTDVEPKNWWYEAVAWAAQNGVVNGYEDESFRPKREITRQEFA